MSKLHGGVRPYDKATNSKMLNLTRLNCNHTLTGAKLSLELLLPMLAGYKESFIAGRNLRDGIKDHRPDIVGQEGPEVVFTADSLDSFGESNACSPSAVLVRARGGGRGG